MAMPTIRITCKLCSRSGPVQDFKQSCDNEGCKIEMARRRGRNNKGNARPPAIVLPMEHDPHCTCNRCLDSGATQLERELEKAWELHNKEAGISLPAITLRLYDSPVIGPYEDRDVESARFVVCPMGIVGHITPKGRRRK